VSTNSWALHISAGWDAYTMQPISEHEKRWAYLSQKHFDTMERQAVDK